jgi:hypothetical protein
MHCEPRFACVCLSRLAECIMADETIRNDLTKLDQKTRGDILIRPKKLIEYEINTSTRGTSKKW